MLDYIEELKFNDKNMVEMGSFARQKQIVESEALVSLTMKRFHRITWSEICLLFIFQARFKLNSVRSDLNKELRTASGVVVGKLEEARTQVLKMDLQIREQANNAQVCHWRWTLLLHRIGAVLSMHPVWNWGVPVEYSPPIARGVFLTHIMGDFWLSLCPLTKPFLLFIAVAAVAAWPQPLLWLRPSIQPVHVSL